jgi:hypothetical protein
MEKTRRELELESLILQNKIEATQLKWMLENSMFVSKKMTKLVDNIIIASKL